MANKKNTTRKNTIKKASQPRWRGAFTKRTAIVGLALVLAVGAVLLAPKNSPLSLASLTGRTSDRTAPKLDTLAGNYSVLGEASSTSLLVKYKNSVPDTTKNAIDKQMNAKLKRKIARLGVNVVQVDSEDSIGDTLRKYKAHGEVEYVEPNYLAKRFMVPNDTLYAKQWGLQKIQAPQAWDISQGGYGPIAIIDTGIMADQSDLSGAVLPGYNFVSDTANTNDDNGHGTHVAGIVAASTNNGGGVSSIGYRGSLLPVKVLDANGQGTYGSVASGIIFATDRGAKILNLSLGGSSASRTLQDAINYALSRGVVVVAAAGNNGNDAVVYPAAYNGVIAVSASDQNDNLAGFSSYGSHTYVSAPGVSVVSTYNSGGYATMSGTSMAAPVVSGLIGLALSKGTTTAATVVNDLKSTSDKVGSYSYDQNGWNQYFGYGRINAARLLGAVAPVAPAPSPTDGGGGSTAPKNETRGNANGANPAANLQFDTVVQATIDSLDVARLMLVVKVTSSSDNLTIQPGNLIDVQLSPGTPIKSAGRNISLDSLTVKDELNIKAQWKDNLLNAQEIKLVGHRGR